MSQEQKIDGVSRRGFTALVAGAGVAAAQQRRDQPRPDPFDAPLEFTRKDVAAKARPFAMTQVRLLPGSMFYDAQEWNRGYMSRLPADRLLYNFRANAGLPLGSSDGFPGGGSSNWERPADGTRATELRGHFTGHFLSASANLWASTGDNDAKAKGDEMVAELARCQQKLGGGFSDVVIRAAGPAGWNASAAAESRRPAAGGGADAPMGAVLHHPQNHGRDVRHVSACRQSAGAGGVDGHGRLADRWSASKTEEHMQQILNTEYGGMAETLYNLAAATNNDKWAAAGDRYTKKRFVNPLALRRDQLTGLHVNTHVPQVIAAARRYEISGDTRFHDVADFF